MDNSQSDLRSVKALALVEAMAKDPIKLLPAEWRPDFFLFFRRFSSIFRDDISCHLMVSKWHERSVSLEDARRAFDAATTSEAAAGFKFPSDITAFLETRIVEMDRRRKAAKATEERRAESASFSMGVNIAKLRATREAEDAYRAEMERHNANMRERGLQEIPLCEDFSSFKTVNSFFRDIGKRG